MEEIIVCWFRRDLRLNDHLALNAALKEGKKLLPLFIFDTEILKELPANDPRVQFIHQKLEQLDRQLKKQNSGIETRLGNPLTVWNDLLKEFNISKVYFNKDYEPYGMQRDKELQFLLDQKGIPFESFCDHLLVEPGDILKKDETPYTVYTPFKNRWFELIEDRNIQSHTIDLNNQQMAKPRQGLKELGFYGFKKSNIQVEPLNLDAIEHYDETRNIPARKGTSLAGPHLRFGTISVRELYLFAKNKNLVYVQEIAWREFFSHILYHFPKVVHRSFREKYDLIHWENEPQKFDAWKNGETGFPIVDAGMRELNSTGYMHNRVRMIVASFLCKDLHIDWRWGEAYFAEKLLDFELASNNGNWQWAAGTGCDAAPYFRIFNPTSQQKKFDPDMDYIQKWVSDLNSPKYPSPIVDHAEARKKTLDLYKNISS